MNRLFQFLLFFLALGFTSPYIVRGQETSPTLVQSSVQDPLFARAEQGWFRVLNMRLHFVDSAGRPLDGVRIQMETWAAGGWEGHTARHSFAAGRVFVHTLKDISSVEMDFTKKGYFKNALDLNLLRLPPDTRIEGEVPTLERRIILLRENELLPPMKTNRQLQLGCKSKDDDSTVSVIDVLAGETPKSSFGTHWPIGDGESVAGIYFTALPAPGIEVKQYKPYSSFSTVITDISPRERRVALVMVGAEQGDGFVRVDPIGEPSCEYRFPLDMADAPETGYENEAPLLPEDYTKATAVYWYFRFKGHYGKILVHPDHVEQGDDGGWHLYVFGAITVNAETGNRNVLTPPCE